MNIPVALMANCGQRCQGQLPANVGPDAPPAKCMEIVATIAG